MAPRNGLPANVRSVAQDARNAPHCLLYPFGSLGDLTCARRTPPSPLRRRGVPSAWPFSWGEARVMPIPAERTIRPQQTRNFGRFGDAIDVPPLTDVQTRSYERFLQLDVPPEKRTPTGLEG